MVVVDAVKGEVVVLGGSSVGGVGVGVGGGSGMTSYYGCLVLSCSHPCGAVGCLVPSKRAGCGRWIGATSWLHHFALLLLSLLLLV